MVASLVADAALYPPAVRFESRFEPAAATLDLWFIDLAREVIRLAGSPSEVVFKPYASLYTGFEDVPRRQPDIARITRDTAGNTIVSDAINKVHDAVKEGESMVAPLESSGVFPPMVISMVDVGEETGQLPEMLLKTPEARSLASDSSGSTTWLAMAETSVAPAAR